MGCGGSKLDQLRPVALCRDRSHFLEDAMRHRYALAEAHGAYLSSMRSVGASLQRFFDESCCLETSSSPSSPLLTLPPHSHSKGKCKDVPSLLSPVSSVCGSHLHLCESSEDEEDDGHSSESNVDFGFPHSYITTERGVGGCGGGGGGEYHYGSSSSSSFPPFDAVKVTGVGGFGNVTNNVNHSTSHYFHYARKGPPQSVVGIQRTKTAFESEEFATVQVGNFGSGQPSCSPFPNPYDGFNYYNDGYGYLQSSQQCGGYGRASGGFHHTFGGFSDPFASSSSSSSCFRGMGNGPSYRPPPPPPSPPCTTTWDFLNPFGAFDNLYKVYGSNNSLTPSRSSREVREEEGIPELEDENGEEIFVGHNISRGTYASAAVASSSANHGETTSLLGNFVPTEDGNVRNNGQRMRNCVRSINCGRNSTIIDKNFVRDGNCQGRSLEKGGVRSNLVEGGSLPVPNVLEEIKAQFDKASASCKEMSELLEVGKHAYHQRRYKVGSSIMMHAMVPSSLSPSSIFMPSCSMNGECSAENLSSPFEAGKEKCQRTGSLLATLEKLYIWEKKLYEEVRAEEQLRMLHDKKCKQLKRLDDGGAETQKVEATRAVIKELSTKIRISIQVIKSISNRISKLRDEELWPLLKKLIQGLFKMWQSVLSCHGNQFRALTKAQTLDANASAFSGKVGDAHMEATVQLAMAILKWIETFSCWIDATKSYVKSLNSWLKKCLNYEPEVTANGIAPFSPGSLGAPPIFVVCNSWSQALDRISESEVVEAMQDFTAGILRIWQQHYTERKMRLLTDKDMDRKLKTLDIEGQKIHKAVEAVKKRCSKLPSQNHLPFTRDLILLSQTGEASNLHLDLMRIFELMEKFASSSMQAYLEL